MAPGATTGAPAAPAKTDFSQSDVNSQDASQDSGAALSNMTNNFSEQKKRKSAERRQEKTTAIKSAHSERMKKLRNDVQLSFADHETQLRAIRLPNVERLLELLQMRRKLEARIDKCQSDFARSFDEAAQQLHASVNGRVEDLTN